MYRRRGLSLKKKNIYNFCVHTFTPAWPHVAAAATLSSSSCRLSCVPPTFLRSTAFRGEIDENRQDENPGPSRSPAHHYRSAHSSLQSECILLASGPAAPLQPVPRWGGGYKKLASDCPRAPKREVSSARVSFCCRLTVQWLATLSLWR